jgi:hypothetical protein
VQFMTVIYVKIFILDILNAVNVYRPWFELVISQVTHWSFMMPSSTEFLHFSWSCHESEDYIGTLLTIGQDLKNNLKFAFFGQPFVTIDLIMVLTRINLLNFLAWEFIGLSKGWLKVPIELKLRVYVLRRLDQRQPDHIGNGGLNFLWCFLFGWNDTLLLLNLQLHLFL